MTDADRLRRAMEDKLGSLIAENMSGISKHVARAIVDEFGLTRECLCDDWSPNCDHCIKKLILGWAILDVAGADDE